MDDRGTRLATTFAEIARTLLSERDRDTILRKIVAVAVEEVEGCESAGIELIENRRIRPIVSSSDVALRISEVQNEVGEGPCLSAIGEHETFRTDDLRQDDRWPKFTELARTETEVRSILGFRLFADEDTMGALDLYSSKPNAFDDVALAVGSILAAHAAIAMSWASEREYMQDALASRDIIGQAKGLLMARRNVDGDVAFELLRDASQRRNIKLHQVAAQLVDPTDPEVSVDDV